MSKTWDERARLIRDHALALVEGKTTFAQVDGVRLAVWHNSSFTIVLRTPFSGRPQEDRSTAGSAAKKPRAYEMEIFTPRKVMHVEWDGSDDLLTVSFRPGDWEEKLLSLSRGIAPASARQSPAPLDDFFGTEAINDDAR